MPHVKKNPLARNENSIPKKTRPRMALNGLVKPFRKKPDPKNRKKQ